jgi:hypothetical protein
MLTRHRSSFVLAGAAVVAGICLLFAGLFSPRAVRAQSKSPDEIVRAYAVGGVLTADGTLWQYMPDKKRWFTVDEAFRSQGKETRILPLPVRVDEIADLSTWGFLVTTSGTCWLYDIQANKWTSVPPPVVPR